MKRLTLLSLFLVCAIASRAQVLTLTGFGTGEFTVDTDFTQLTSYSQSATTLNIVGSDQTGAISGSFAQFDMTGYMGGIDLTASVSGTNPASNFNLVLVDAQGNQFSFSGNWSSFGSSTSTVTLAPVISQNPFLPNQVIGMGFLFGGAGANFNITLDALTVGAAAVPEPSTYAQIALGLGALGLIAYRRRKTA